MKKKLKKKEKKDNNKKTVLTGFEPTSTKIDGFKFIYIYLKPIKTQLRYMLFFFLIDCITARIVYVSNGLSFARERLSKHWAQLHNPVGNCVEK